MKSNSIQTRQSAIKSRTNDWDEQMKTRFAKLCQSNASYAEVIEHAIAEDKQNHRMAKISYCLQCFRNDGVYQLNRAIEEIFGNVTSETDDSPSGENTITTIDVQLSDGTRVKCPYGDISLEGLGEGSQITINYDSNSHELIITGKCQVRFQPLIDSIIDKTKENLANQSIYKGQAIEITDINDPKILDLSSVDNQLMVLSEKTKYDLRPIYARLDSPERCIEKGIPLKYGALMEGGYGTGKTLLAFKLARRAVQQGWMFIYLKNPTLLAESLRMSKIIDHSGWGVVIFCEDIDQVIRGNRDAAMQDILNTLDGGDTKNMNVITLFTTNHIELIEPTFLRGKRIGTIISMGCLDAKTAKVFIESSFAIGNYVINEDLTEVCELIARSNIAPAFMAEIIEKVKAMMVLADENVVHADDIRFSVESYLHQIELSHTKDMSKTKEQEFCDAFLNLTGLNKIAKNAAAAANIIAEYADVNKADYIKD